jgi:xanthine dehydrogenase accessory factor
MLVAVFASPVAGYLLRYGADLGYTCVLVEPDKQRAAGAVASGLDVQDALPATGLDDADLVVTDHHRDELGEMVAAAIDARPRWIGVVGNPRHPAPYLPALRALGVPADRIALVHRPIGLNIGSRRPPEIAISTLAGLIADRNARPGGFEFGQ